MFDKYAFFLIQKNPWKIFFEVFKGFLKDPLKTNA
jgi:hypothetical protein